MIMMRKWWEVLIWIAFSLFICAILNHFMTLAANGYLP